MALSFRLYFSLVSQAVRPAPFHTDPNTMLRTPRKYRVSPYPKQHEDLEERDEVIEEEDDEYAMLHILQDPDDMANKNKEKESEKRLVENRG